MNKLLNHLEWLETLSVRSAVLIFALEAYTIVGMSLFVGYKIVDWLLF
jgi:hypothetical protein